MLVFLLFFIIAPLFSVPVNVNGPGCSFRDRYFDLGLLPSQGRMSFVRACTPRAVSRASQLPRTMTERQESVLSGDDEKTRHKRERPLPLCEQEPFFGPDLDHQDDSSLGGQGCSKQSHEAITDASEEEECRKLQHCPESSFPVTSLKCGTPDLVVKYLSELSQEFQAQLDNEARILLGIEHPCIIELKEIFQEENGATSHIVMEKGAGDAERFLAQISGAGPQDLKLFLRKIADAVKFLHSREIYHGDIKPKNIILIPNRSGFFNPKLIDFGLALSGEEFRLLPAGTPVYAAPELMARPIDGRGYLAAPPDIWALGVTFFVLESGRVPWKFLKPIVALAKEIRFRKIDFRALRSAALAELLEKMLERETSMRICAQEISDQKYFREEDTGCLSGS